MQDVADDPDAQSVQAAGVLTRTHSSFELAAKRLSADVVNFSASGSSVEKGEPLKDRVLALNAHKPDAIVIRTLRA